MRRPPTPHAVRRAAPAGPGPAACEPLEDRRLMSAGPYVSVYDLNVAEGNDGLRTATVSVALSAASNKAVAVNFRTEDGSAVAGRDYQATAGTVTFAPGQTVRTVAVPIIGDRAFEPNEAFYVRLLSTSRGRIYDGLGAVTIYDDEPRVRVSDAAVAEGCGCFGPTPLTFTVSLSVAYDQPVTVSYSTADGSATVADADYAAVAGTLTFAPGETTKTFTVEVLGDKRIEADEVFFVDLASSLLGSPAVGRAAGWILDDDDPTAPPEDPVDPNQCSPENPYYPNCECTPDHPYYPNCGN